LDRRDKNIEDANAKIDADNANNEEKKGEPVKITIHNMSISGKILMDFNQDLEIPE
jgi:hypothetical protein